MAIIERDAGEVRWVIPNCGGNLPEDPRPFHGRYSIFAAIPKPPQCPPDPPCGILQGSKPYQNFGRKALVSTTLEITELFLVLYNVLFRCSNHAVSGGLVGGISRMSPPWRAAPAYGGTSILRGRESNKSPAEGNGACCDSGRNIEPVFLFSALCIVGYVCMHVN